MKVPRRPGVANPQIVGDAIRVTTAYKATPKGLEDAADAARSSSLHTALGMAALPE